MPSLRGLAFRARLLREIILRPGQLVEFPSTRTDLFEFLRPDVPGFPIVPSSLFNHPQREDVDQPIVESSEPEVARVLYLMAAVQQARRVVEVGVFRGDTSRFLAAAVAERAGELHLVDRSRAALEAAKASAGQFPSTRVTTHQGESSDPKVAAGIPDCSDLIYLDADHSEAGVSAELTLWLPKLRANGVLAIHDSVHYTGVCRAVNRVASTHRAVTMATGRGCGLTLVRWQP